MNDEINKINEQNRKLNEPSPGDQSQARFSEIKTNEEDQKASMAQRIIQEQQIQREDIDSIKQAVTGIAQQVNQITQLINQSANPNQLQQTPEAKPLNMETIAALGDLAEKGVEVYKTLKGQPAQTALIDQEFINKRMVQSFMDDLDTGTSITNFIKDSLKKKVTKEVINSSLSDMGKDTHAPQ